MTLRILSLLALAALVMVLTATPAPAADSASAPLFAGYWGGFIDHWTAVLQKQNGIVMATLVVGAICLFIITRGRWRKSH